MNTIDISQVRKSSLRMFVIFLVLTAGIAVISVLSGEFGELQVKILSTCFIISMASILAMACAAFTQKRKRRELGLTGIGLSVLSAFSLITMIWVGPDSDFFVRSTVSLAVAAAGFAHAFLLVIQDLEQRYRWVQVTGCLSVAILAMQLMAVIWLDEEVLHQWFFRFLTVVAILVGLQTLVVPLLMKLSKSAVEQTGRLLLARGENDVYVDVEGRKYRVVELAD
jgi:hypothetical protein